jgi:electron transport complex protein RnfG
MAKAKERGSAYPIVFLTLVVLVSVVALTLIDGVTREKIAAAQRDEIKEMLAALFPEMDDYEFDEATSNYGILTAGQPVGRAFMARKTGYGGAVDVLVGLETDGTLRGIRVISQQETPGLGAKIIEPAFLNQFSGLSVEELALRQDGGAVDAITGATISSSTVVDAVKEALLERLGEGGE